MSIYFSHIYGSAECGLIRLGKSALSCGSGWAQALMQACSMYLDSEQRLIGKQIPRGNAFHGEGRRRANTFFPSACVVSPYLPLAEASHVAKLKNQGIGY